jgi:MoaA/NifB/PqqE/SkfB family radical SAM enzyme
MEQWADIYRQASSLGVSIIMIAGGEPLMKPELLDILKQFKKIVFILFTNGMLLTPGMILKLKKIKNVLPVISIDGMKNNHDNRRGVGTFDKIIHQMKYLKENNLRYGVSITATKENFNQVIGLHFMESLVAAGIQIGFFIEFVPKDKNSTSLVLSSKQQHELEKKIKDYNDLLKKPLITFPGNEEQYGGCLAAGRGFVHIGTDGNIEPCPFAPFSDINVTKASLKESLQSTFLYRIRKNHEKLTETLGGCALWSNRNWVNSLLVSEQNQEQNNRRQHYG